MPEKTEEQIELTTNSLFIVILVIIIMGLSAIIILRPVNNSDKIGRLTRIESVMEKYASQDEIRISQFELNNDMTLSQIKQMYYAYKMQPAAKSFVLDQVNYVCDG
jgi:regulatory protein YycI of two-component signal transduction system YycFG